MSPPRVLIAFAIFFGVGLSLAKIFQSEQFRRLLTRLKLGKKFASIIPTIFGLATPDLFHRHRHQCCGCPLAWNQPLPAFRLLSFKFSCSLPSSWGFSGYRRAPNHFFLTRFLGKQAGWIDRCNTLLRKSSATSSWSLAVFIVLDNCRHSSSGRLTVFAGCVASRA